MIKINKSPRPFIASPDDSAKHLFDVATDNLCKAVAAGKEVEFSNAIYSHKEVKEKLLEDQFKKCCFCESIITHISSGDVEHFRPKAAYCQGPGENIAKPGYYWLAYDWDNLLICCENCNRRFKKNLFPLIDPSKRATSENDDLSREEPVFIHPALEDPANFINFREEIPYGIDKDGRGEATIVGLGLRRYDLNSVRGTKLDLVKSLIKAYDLNFKMLQMIESHVNFFTITDVEECKFILNELESDILQLVKAGKGNEYSAMLHANFPTLF